jgi:hypothetical protein
MSEKAAFDDFEKAEHHDITHDLPFTKHGDRALSLIGNERVTLTDEEVGIRIYLRLIQCQRLTNW